MTTDREDPITLTSTLCPDCADPRRNGKKRWHAEGFDFTLIRNAIPLGEDSIVSIPWALTVEKDGDLVYTVQIEKDDLRILSSLTGESVRTLQSDYGVRGFYSLERVSMYGNGSKETLGEGCPQGDDEIETYLLDAALDSLDIVDELEEE